MYKCECGAEYDSVSKFGGHCAHCRVHLGHDPIDCFGDGGRWSKGRTKHNDERIARMADRRKQLIADGKIKAPFSGRTHSEETKRKMSKSATVVANEHRNGWEGGDSRVQNKYELFTEAFLRDNNISYESEVSVKQSEFGKKGSYYQFDFLINGEIDLEIDGTSHLPESRKLHDVERDSYVEKKFTVYRIQHNDNMDVLEAELKKFLQYLQGMCIT